MGNPKGALAPKRSLGALRKGDRLRKALVILELICASLFIAAIITATPQSAGDLSAKAQAGVAAYADEKVSNEEFVEIPDQVATSAECEHEWVPLMQTVDHPPTTHVVEHAAEYGVDIAYHTVCNECRQVIDGKAQSHIEKTGHSGFTREVPINEKRLICDAWTETIVDREAWTESVICGYACTLCDAESESIA